MKAAHQDAEDCESTDYTTYENKHAAANRATIEAADAWLQANTARTPQQPRR